jgi:hypothetical protein
MAATALRRRIETGESSSVVIIVSSFGSHKRRA